MTLAVRSKCEAKGHGMRRRNAAGFTLLEVMVTVGIVAILSSLTLPSFSDYFKRGRIPDATMKLAVLRLQMEQYFQDNQTYAGAPACASSPNTYFSFSCTVQDATQFELRAVGKGSMDKFAFSIDASNVQRTTSVPSGWRLPAGDCWAMRKDGSC